MREIPGKSGRVGNSAIYIYVIMSKTCNLNLIYIKLCGRLKMPGLAKIEA